MFREGGAAFMQNKKTGTLLVLLAGIFWGCVGIFVRFWSARGFDSEQIVCLRFVGASVVFLAIQLVRDPHCLKIRLRDVPLFLVIGLGTVFAATSLYFLALQEMSMSAAAILLNTAPIWVMLISATLFHEKITARKLLALILAFGGCTLVSDISGGSVTLKGFVIGLISGIAYSLYSILSSVALRRYSTATLNAWCFMLSAVGGFVLCRPAELIAGLAAQPSAAGTVALILLTGVCTSVVPFLAYSMGLSRIEASRAAILATTEPIVATIVGVLIYHETLTLFSTLGIVCVLSAIAVLNTEKPKAKDVSPALRGK